MISPGRLAKGVYSGLQEARDVLKNTKGIAIVELDDADVVRHQLVSRLSGLMSGLMKTSGSGAVKPGLPPAEKNVLG